MVRDFVNTELRPIAKDIDEQESIPMEFIHKMRDLGLMGTAFPQDIQHQAGDEGAILRPGVAGGVSPGLQREPDRPVAGLDLGQNINGRRQASAVAQISTH